MSPLAIPNPAIGLGTGSANQAVIGTGLSVPSGIDMPISFNGLILNNRQWIDTYVVQKIAGLSDATIRDDRENNPDADGETYFEAYYGGKTFTLSGYIRCFNLAKLDDMEQALRAAFHNIKVEQPMVFHHRNPQGVAQIMCKKGAELVCDDEQTTENYFRRDFMITMKASNPRIQAKTETLVESVLGWADQFEFDSRNKYTKTGDGMSVAGGYLVPSNSNANLYIRDESVLVPNVKSLVEVKSGTGGTPLNSMDLRIILRRKDANNYVYAKWTGTGGISIEGVVAGVTTTLASTSNSGITNTASTNYWFEFSASANVLNARVYIDGDPRDLHPVGGVLKQISHTIADPTQAAAFGETVRGQQGVSMKATSTFGFTNISAAAYSLSAESVFTVPNLGNGDAQPKITLSGRMGDPVITNSNRSESLSFTKNGGLEIYAGQSVEIDIAEDTIFRNTGLREWSHLTIDSDWLEISPGQDEILLTATNLGAQWDDDVLTVPSIGFLYRSTWI